MVTISTEDEKHIRGIISESVSGVDLHEKLFGPQGVFFSLCKNKEERAEIVKTPLYLAGKTRLLQLRGAETRRFKADTDKASHRRAAGRLTLHVPISLYEALKEEARNEGISLSELVRLKVSAPYSDVVDILRTHRRQDASTT